MEDKKPYEELDRFFSDLPLPDEDRAWDDMKRRLETEDDDRFVVLPPFLHGCAGWTLLLALLLGGALWLFIHYSRETGEHQTATLPTEQKEKDDATLQGGRAAVKSTKANTTGFPSLPGTTSAATRKGGEEGQLIKTTSVHTSQRKNGAPGEAAKEFRAHRETTALASYDKKKRMPKAVNPTTGAEAARDRVVDSREDDTPAAVNTDFGKVDSVTSRPDTTGHQPPAPPADSTKNTPAPGQNKKKKYRIGAGIALQQQLPVGGQHWTPYNYRGRSGSLADYIPSVYLRVYREQKWFLQGEFKYGAPQYTKEFVYKKEFKADTIGGTALLSSTSYRLKKTYYHQLPISLNYFLNPHWSVGTGVVYNRFFAAVSEKELRQRNSAAIDTLVRKEMVQDNNDSLFRQSNLQWLLESQYHWKRLSVGGRFAQGLQPFIEYTNAQGQLLKQKNFSLNLFIRYELWRSKKD